MRGEEAWSVVKKSKGGELHVIIPMALKIFNLASWLPAWLLIVGYLLVLPQSVLADQPGQSWAVVIGIEDYQTEPKLQFAVDDAQEIAHVLGQRGFRVLPPLLNEQATRDAILDLLQGDLSRKVGSQDRVVVYFSGHGVTWGAGGTARLGYLMPVEGNRSQPYRRGISMQEIKGIANALPARQVLFLIDACYGGMAGGIERGGKLPVMDDIYVQQLQREKGRWVMTAGGADQEALELGERRHGVFTYFLLEGLGAQRVADQDNNRYITVGELFHFVKPRVFEQAQIQGKNQVPELWNLSVGDKGEMVFVYPDTSPTVVAKAPAYQALPQTITGKDGASMVLIPEGTFWMGSTAEEVEAVVKECVGYEVTEETCRDWFKGEVPRHKVTLNAFYLDTQEVTNRLFEAFVNTPPGYQTTAEREGEAVAWVEGKGWELVKGASWKNPEGNEAVFVSNRADHPVVSVTWDDAKAYCDKYGKRLPTEAEWEYAARAGTATRNWWGNEPPGSRRVANIADVSTKGLFNNYLASYDDGFVRTAPVGAMAANPWGLYDMIGNVWEWTVDWYGENYYAHSPKKNPKGPDTGDYRVLRGGSWGNRPFDARSANRYWNRPTLRLANVGFRCVQDAP